MGTSIRLPDDQIEATFDKHGATRQQITAFYKPGSELYVWPITELKIFKAPYHYRHPGGGASTRIGPDNVPLWEKLQQEIESLYQPGTQKVAKTKKAATVKKVTVQKAAKKKQAK